MQSPPVFIGATASINQTFHTSTEPSQESNEPEASLNPTPPWSEPVPSNPDPVTVPPNYFTKLMFSPPKPTMVEIPPTVQAPSQQIPPPSPMPDLVPDPVENWPEDRAEERMITPCEDYTQHYAWLQHNFPLIHTSQRKYFVHLVLKIRTFKDVGNWLVMSPEQWVSRLGYDHYSKYIDTIVDLVLIWHFMFDITHPVPYDDFCDHYMEFKDGVEGDFKSLIRPTKDRPNPLEPSSVNYKSTSKTPPSSSPPVYTRISPIVANASIGSSDSSKKTKDLDGDSYKRRYEESSPNVIDSSRLPLVAPNGNPDESSASLSASKSSKKKPKKASSAY